MNKEIITEIVFEKKVLERFRILFKQSELNFSGTKQERAEILELDINVSVRECENFNQAFITEYIENFKIEEERDYYQYSSFFKDLCLSTEMTSNNSNITFSKGALSTNLFKNLEIEDIILLHSRFSNMQVQADLYVIALEATKDIMESFRYNNSITFDPKFNIIEILYSLVGYSAFNDVYNDKTLNGAKYFQDYFLQNLNYHVKNKTANANEEDIENIASAMSGFWYHHHKNGYTLTPLYFDFYNMLDMIKEKSLNDFILETKKSAFKSYTINLEDLTNKAEAKKYFSINLNKDVFSMSDNVVKIHEDQLKVFDLNNLFILTENQTETNKSLANFFKESKNISSLSVNKDDDGMVSIQWSLKTNIEQDVKEINKSIQLFIKDKLENIENYVGDFSNKLKNECRELDLLITLSQKENKENVQIKRMKI